MTQGQIASYASQSLPIGWRRVRLGDLGQFMSGGTPPKGNEEYWHGDTPFVTGADITDYYITRRSARAFLTEAGLRSDRTAVCPPGTVLLVTRTRVGRVGIAAELMGASQDLSPFVCGPDVYAEYLCWYLRSISSRLLALCRGATIQGLTRDTIADLDIPLPPLSEQRRIAAILREQLAAVERARAAAEAQLAAARELPAAYLRAVFESDEARGWPVVALSEVAAITGGIQRTPGRRPSRFHRPYLTVRNVQRGALDLSNVERFEVTPDELAHYRLESGDILIVEGNGSSDQIGRNAVFAGEVDECVHQNHIIRVRCVENRCRPQFVSHYLNSDAGKAQMLDKARTTSGLFTLSVAKIEHLRVPVPPLNVQETGVGSLNEQISKARRLRDSLEAELQAVNRLPESLLRRAFNGEL